MRFNFTVVVCLLAVLLSSSRALAASGKDKEGNVLDVDNTVWCEIEVSKCNSTWSAYPNSHVNITCNDAASPTTTDVRSSSCTCLDKKDNILNSTNSGTGASSSSTPGGSATTTSSSSSTTASTPIVSSGFKAETDAGRRLRRKRRVV